MHSPHRGGGKDHLRSSTLFNETGNIRLYRVSEETRKKVAEDSKRVHDEMVRHNAQSRRRFRQEENEKFRTREKFRTAMVSRWVEKYKDSPFSVDLYETEEKRKMRQEEISHRKKIYDEKVRLVAAMKSEADNIYGKTAIDKMGFKYQTNMALKYQQYLLDDSQIRRDNKRLSQMLYDELAYVAEQFPEVADRSMQLSMTNGGESRPDVISYGIPQSTLPDDEDALSQESESDFPLNPYFEDRGDRSHESRHQHPTSSVSTGFSGPLDYSSPEARMKELQDDLSEKFSETHIL